MTKSALEYAKLLAGLRVSAEAIRETKNLLELVPQLRIDLENPVLDIEKKHVEIEETFPATIRNFLKVICDNQDFSMLEDVFAAYEQLDTTEPEDIKADLRYVVPPTEDQLEKIKAFLAKKHKNAKLEIQMTQDESLLGGFVIRVGNQEYDWSMKSRLEKLGQKLKSSSRTFSGTDDIITILKEEIAQSDFDRTDKEIGLIETIGDGIVTASGIDHAMYGEIVIFENGVKGMVQDIRSKNIGIILFGRESGLKEGSRVMRTGKRAGIPVGREFLGRVVDALGAPIDGKGEIAEEDYRPIEQDAPSIVERKSVGVPMETGILAIDSMFPIGRGQRELIIGDRQTGKTSIATDTIINQKGKDVICIYVAIGQKASTIAKVASLLEKHDAMSYSIIVAATASDPASLQYIAPYSGTALAEYFMHKGKDVLIVYDDLSKHAVAYRALSLLLERSPGREAYPGDVFYLHSRLLERSSRLSTELGGGSITALPIIETQAGDVSAYIPTNIISITDGQIYLESALFNRGMRPAINVGISVSRVGGSAQIKSMKKVAGTLKIDQAQYRELEAFSKFSSDMDAVTAMTLDRGRKNNQLLIQPQYSPMPVGEQIAILYCASASVRQR